MPSVANDWFGLGCPDVFVSVTHDLHSLNTSSLSHYRSARSRRWFERTSVVSLSLTYSCVCSQTCGIDSFVMKQS